MPFKPPKKPPQFADLKVTLAKSNETDNALYQTISVLIDRLDQFKSFKEEEEAAVVPPIGEVPLHAPTHSSGGTDPVTITALAGFTNDPNTFLRGDKVFAGVAGIGGQSFITANAEPTLPAHRRLVAGNGIALDIATPSEIRVNATGSGMNLDYLGNYAAGPVYNDGDIVIGPDNIAYMCVVDGTTTPPEPWPGVGMATAVGPPGPPGPQGPAGPAGTNAAVDATYWTVSPHAGLSNERAMNAFASGYVKSTGGEPSTVAVIPLSEGGTGSSLSLAAQGTVLGSYGGVVQFMSGVNISALNASVLSTGIVPLARLQGVGLLESQNTWATLNIFDGSVDQMLVRGTTGASVLLRTSDSPATKRDIRMWNVLGDFQLMSLNAGGTVQTTIFQVTGEGVASGNGAGLTNLHAPNLATGIVNPARLGSGAANAGTFLRGDSTWQPVPSFPSGLIVLSDVPCPIGWTRVNWDGRFLRVNAAAGAVGGAADHSHGPGSYRADSHSHGGSVDVSVSVSGNTSNDGGHNHHVGGSVAGTTGGGSGSVQTADAGSSFQTLTPPHVHNFSANIDTNTDQAGQHSHSFNGSGGGSGSIGAESPGVNGVSAVASSLPPFIDVILCRKD